MRLLRPAQQIRLVPIAARWTLMEASLVRTPWTQQPHHRQRQRGLGPSPASQPTPRRRVRMDFKQSPDNDEVAPTAMDTE